MDEIPAAKSCLYWLLDIHELDSGVYLPSPCEMREKVSGGNPWHSSIPGGSGFLDKIDTPVREVIEGLYSLRYGTSEPSELGEEDMIKQMLSDVGSDGDFALKVVKQTLEYSKDRAG